jgi:hypothetical protein
MNNRSKIHWLPKAASGECPQKPLPNGIKGTQYLILRIVKTGFVYMN